MTEQKKHGLVGSSQPIEEWYSQMAETTIRYPNPDSLKALYPHYGLIEEAGEVAGLLAKRERDNTPPDVFAEKLQKELGDIVWMLRAISYQLPNDGFAMALGTALATDVSGIVEGYKEYEFEGTTGFMMAVTDFLVTLSVQREEGTSVPELRTLAAISDLLTYVATLSGVYGFTFESVLETNIAKLQKRVADNTIHGEGSDR